MKLKHIYNNQNLKNYCDDNNFNYSTILKKLNDLKKLDEYKDLTDNEIIKIIIEKKYKTKYKYFYNNQNLKTYCNDNNLSYKFVVGKINNLKKLDEYKDLSIDKMIEIVLTEHYTTNSKKKYFYNNQYLKVYCIENKLNYKSILNKVKRLRKLDEYKDLNNDQIVEMVIEKKYITNAKYFYKNETLDIYCQKNNLNYNIITKTIKKIEQKEQYKNLELTELIELIINNFKPQSKNELINLKNNLEEINFENKIKKKI